jgi:hypothetical protein
MDQRRVVFGRLVAARALLFVAPMQTTQSGEAKKKNGTHTSIQLSTMTEPVIPDRARNIDGWRSGKPEEDPEKMKKWGFISAKPSEFLIRMRGGKVVASGQGASCFKWPWCSGCTSPRIRSPARRAG